MKIIRVDDRVHEQLKQQARREGRTLQWVVEQKLTGENTVPVSDNVHTVEEPTLVSDSQEWSPQLQAMMDSGMIKKGL